MTDNTVVTQTQYILFKEELTMTNNSSSSSTSSKSNVPEAREALNRFKYEVASEIGVPLKQGYNGDLTSAQNGYVGGYMVKKMIEEQERMMAGKSSTPSSTSSR